jgi:hypothetical protein
MNGGFWDGLTIAAAQLALPLNVRFWLVEHAEHRVHGCNLRFKEDAIQRPEADGPYPLACHG